MTVTKRLRYEILRRDEHTCRYCHATDSPLTVDHVVPKALGGSDEASNLVAACKDCNAGKSSAGADSSLVAEVREDALRHAEMIRQAYAVIVYRMGERDEYLEEFWNNWIYEMPNEEWRNSIVRFFEMGIPIEIVTEAAQIACRKTQTFYRDGRFKYMCGIVWKQVYAVTEAVTLKEALDGSFMSEASLTDVRVDAYEQGFKDGKKRGWDSGWQTFAFADCYTRILSNVIDGPDTSHTLPPDKTFIGPDIDLSVREPVFG